MERRSKYRGQQCNCDANATYGVLPEVWDALAECEEFSREGILGNPSSIHRAGQLSKSLIEETRDTVHEVLDVPEEWAVVFCSGATEANNAAFENLRFAVGGDPCSIVISAVEHPSLIAAAERLLSHGVDVRVVSPHNGTIRVEDVLGCCTESTRLVSVMIANNETGTIFPLASIASEVRHFFPQALIHTDAVQAVGKTDLSVRRLEVDLVTISGHKIGAFCGVGALLVGPRVTLVPSIIGGPQEGRLRGGTENVVGIFTLGIALREWGIGGGMRRESMLAKRSRFLAKLSHHLGPLELVEGGPPVLPNTASIRFPGVRADDLVVALDLEGVLVSSGAACGSGKPEPSHVFLKFGLSEKAARETIRFSFTGEPDPLSPEAMADVVAKCISRASSEGD